ncbi:alpha/beta hydrolase-fold protein [Gordonia sp. DT218]|uniref:alpha/beta hydrolase n=1 Tax=Gordonia sp. DT218 TaxID=3416659 RepID=UPI003CE6DEEA
MTRHPGAGRRAVAALLVVFAALLAGAGQAAAVNPTSQRSGCSYANAADKADNVQTCTVWSDAMQSDLIVKVRPSSQLPGQQEQAVYFLGGIGGGDEGGSILSQYGTQYTLVTIEGSSNAWSSNWESVPVDAGGNTLNNRSGGTYDPQWETFIGEELPAYLDQNFDVDQSGNAIVGLSMGGGQAVNIALKYPEVFSVAHSISGYYQTDSVFGYLLIPYILSSRNGISNGLTGMWGNPFAPGNLWAANDVMRQIVAAKESGQTIIISAGTGIITSSAEFDELWGLGGISEVIAGSVLEFGSFASALVLNGVALALDLPVEFHYTNGAHTWVHWDANMSTEAGMVQDALTKYEVPSATEETIPSNETVSPVVSAPVPAMPSAVPTAPVEVQGSPLGVSVQPTSVDSHEPTDNEPVEGARGGPREPTAPERVNEPREATADESTGTESDSGRTPSDEPTRSNDEEGSGGGRAAKSRRDQTPTVESRSDRETHQHSPAAGPADSAVAGSEASDS